MTNDPTPEEILERRAEIHRARGEHDEARRITEAGVVYGNLFPSEPESEPRFKTIYEIGLPSRIAGPLERAGVMFAGELCGFTEDRLRLFNFGDKSIKRIQEALASVGLKVREPGLNEALAPLPKPIVTPKRPSRVPRLTDRQVERMFELVAFGNSQRTTAKLMDICRWTVWNRMRIFKEKVKDLYGMGANDRQVRSKLGDNRWTVWQMLAQWNARRVGAA